MGYISTCMGDHLSALLVSLMANRLKPLMNCLMMFVVLPLPPPSGRNSNYISFTRSFHHGLLFSCGFCDNDRYFVHGLMNSGKLLLIVMVVPKSLHKYRD